LFGFPKKVLRRYGIRRNDGGGEKFIQRYSRLHNEVIGTTGGVFAIIVLLKGVAASQCFDLFTDEQGIFTTLASPWYVVYKRAPFGHFQYIHTWSHSKRSTVLYACQFNGMVRRSFLPKRKLIYVASCKLQRPFSKP
jgi:hypothetical protein